MNRLERVRIIKIIWIIIGLIILQGCSSNKSSKTAAKDVDNIVIPASDAPDECLSGVIYSGGDNCNSNQCGSNKDCICSAKDKKITWLMAGKKKFKLEFIGDFPFSGNCSKNYKKKISCMIEDEFTEGKEFTYKVILKGCTDGSDPRIIIRSRD